MRIAVVSELHAESWSKSRIIDTFTAMTDYDRRITEYQVCYIIKKGYTPFKCSTIQGLDECLLMACPIYRKRRLSLSRRAP
jgi:DNA primase large subunit